MLDELPSKSMHSTFNIYHDTTTPINTPEDYSDVVVALCKHKFNVALKDVIYTRTYNGSIYETIVMLNILLPSLVEDYITNTISSAELSTFKYIAYGSYKIYVAQSYIRLKYPNLLSGIKYYENILMCDSTIVDNSIVDGLSIYTRIMTILNLLGNDYILNINTMSGKLANDICDAYGIVYTKHGDNIYIQCTMHWINRSISCVNIGILPPYRICISKYNHKKQLLMGSIIHAYALLLTTNSSYIKYINMLSIHSDILTIYAPNIKIIDDILYRFHRIINTIDIIEVPNNDYSNLSLEYRSVIFKYDGLYYLAINKEDISDTTREVSTYNTKEDTKDNIIGIISIGKYIGLCDYISNVLPLTIYS
jgi:hypothetical protein